MKLLIVGHALAAAAVVFASVMTVQFVGVAQSWIGVPLGVLLYGLTLFVAKEDANDKEAP